MRLIAVGDMEPEVAIGQDSSRGIRIPTHPQNLKPEMCPADKMCRDRDSRD